MWILVALGVVGLVALLRHSADKGSETGQTGTSNGVSVSAAVGSDSQKLTFKAAIGLFGATGAPSPYTGLGAPGSNIEYKNILDMQNPPGGPRFNALLSQYHPKGTGLLDPLPAGSGTRSKELLTKDVVGLKRGGKV